MVRIRIPPSRVRGQHVLLLWQMMQELGAPCPQFFEEMPDDGTHSYRRVVVVLSGVPSDMDFYVELSTMQRSSDETLPM